MVGAGNLLRRPGALASAKLAKGMRRALGRAPTALTRSPRRRRLLALGLCAPGFFGIASTPFHRNLGLLAAAAAAFAAALAYRRLSEPFHIKAETTAQRPCPDPLHEDAHA